MRTSSRSGFNCLALKRRVQARVHAQTRGLSVEDELAWYRRRVAAGPFAALWRRLGRGVTPRCRVTAGK